MSYNWTIGDYYDLSLANSIYFPFMKSSSYYINYSILKFGISTYSSSNLTSSECNN